VAAARAEPDRGQVLPTRLKEQQPSSMPVATPMQGAAPEPSFSLAPRHRCASSCGRRCSAVTGRIGCPAMPREQGRRACSLLHAHSRAHTHTQHDASSRPQFRHLRGCPRRRPIDAVIGRAERRAFVRRRVLGTTCDPSGARPRIHAARGLLALCRPALRCAESATDGRFLSSSGGPQTLRALRRRSDGRIGPARRRFGIAAASLEIGESQG
jgi:hypothetical protein